MKTFAMLILVAGALWTVPSVRAAEVAPTNQATAQVAQSELAKLLVEVLGLSRFLPADPTPAQCYALLLANGISPKEGWDSAKTVTRADLARVIVQALKKTNEIKDPDNPSAWIDYLVGIGIPIDSVGLAVKPLEPLMLPISPSMYTAQVDPLLKESKQIMAPITQYGTVMTPIRELFRFKPIPPKPVTPTAPQGVRF